MIVIKADRRAAFRRNLRGPVRALWGGVIDDGQFFEEMQLAIARGLTDAWEEGAKKCGIAIDELSPEEELALQSAINDQLSFVPPFGTAIITNSKANKGKLTPLFARTELWVNQYDSTVGQAQTMACADQKLKWVLHGAFFTEEPCTTCLRLNGKVKRASFWLKRGIRPQDPPNENLVCAGWQCGCAFQVTDEPLSKGPLPIQ